MKKKEKEAIELMKFIEYCEVEKIFFIAHINSLPWRQELRTQCEDIIIAYDQMLDRLKK